MTYRTYAEYLATPQFTESCRLVRIRSRGRCENEVLEHDGLQRCQNLASDVHHVRYCKWGQFDPPENLLHVCRKCHEELHTCPGCGRIFGADWIKEKRSICFECYQRQED